MASWATHANGRQQFCVVRLLFVSCNPPSIHNSVHVHSLRLQVLCCFSQQGRQLPSSRVSRHLCPDAALGPDGQHEAVTIDN